jgi:DNA polymerase III delta prime subunit
MKEEFLWVEKYRPKTIEDTILPAELKTVFQRFVTDGTIPNLLLCGSAGVGKTTVAMAMLEEVGADYILINGSLEGRLIDTLRNDIANYASTISFTGGRKYVIIDEADYLNSNTVQPALRGFIEEFSKTCGFILTCNFKNRIIEPLHSRCSVIDFKIGKNDKAKLAMQFMKRVGTILDTEGVSYDKAVVAEVIQKYFPDWRRVLNEFQRYAASGAIDSGILTNMTQASIKDLILNMKEKNFTEVRKWAKNNLDTDVNYLYNEFYEYANEYIDPSYIPALILLIAKYQYQNSFAANAEINFVAFCAETMIEIKFK